jgi:hypothetical protein
VNSNSYPLPYPQQHNHRQQFDIHSTTSAYLGILKQQYSAATATMGFMGLTSPFKKDSVDNYEGVLVPLANAARHPTVVAEYARRRSAANDSSDGNSDDPLKKDGAKPGEENGVMRMTSEGYSPYTVEGLRAEIHEDVATSGRDSAYDCEPSLEPRMCEG